MHSLIQIKEVKKSHIPVVNAPRRLKSQKKEIHLQNESATCERSGRPLIAKHLKPRKSRRMETSNEKIDDTSNKG